MRRLNTTLIQLLLLMVMLMPHQAIAVNPDEVLSDPVLETRARALSAQLRCLVCQNQSIDDSDADLARDLRLRVRERLTKGDSDNEVLDYLVERYGPFILLKPRLSILTYLLWGTPIVLLLLGGTVLIFSLRRRSKSVPQPLSSDEQAALAKILNDREQNT